MAKKYIIKQTTNWNGKGEKTGTHVVMGDEADVTAYIAHLDGNVEVFEQNTTLSVAGVPTSTSLNIVDFIAMRKSGAQTVYISNSNKRPIVFKDPVTVVKQTLEQFKPFALLPAEKPSDVSMDLGNMNLL